MNGMGIDFDRLKGRLKEIEEAPPPLKEGGLHDPCRGLSGELLRKMLAGLAGHRSGKTTPEENEEIKRVQLEHDKALT